MLHFIREKAQGWIAWTIVGLLIIPFALWGINQYFGNGGQLVAATVNGTEISQQAFQQAFYEQRGRMQEMLGQQYDARIMDPQVRQRAINELVDSELLSQYADQHGYRVSNNSVVATIQGIDAFRENGVFSTELYRQQVQAQGQSTTMFEHRVKKALLTSQLPMGLAGSVFITDAELNEILRLQAQKREASYLKLDVKKYQDQADATDEAVQQYYEANRERFMTPEKVSVEYIELAASDLGKDKHPTEDQLRAFYKEHSTQYVVPEERRASHILIKIPEAADDSQVEAARAKANEVLARVRKGESFKALAKEFSDDPGSAKQGGDLGFFGRGIMEPDFENAAFSLKEGEVSDLVLTSFGFHIIKLDEIRAEKAKPFEQVRAEILKQYQQDAAEKEYFDLAEKLTNLAYETPDSLASVADKLGLKLQTSGFVARSGGEGIFANPKVMAAAFSAEVVKQGYNSEPIEIGENHVVVLRMKEHQPAADQPLEAVADQIKRMIVAQKGKERAQAAAEALLKRLEKGESRAAIAKELGGEWQKAGVIERSAAKPEPAIVRQVLRLPRPAGDTASYGSVGLASGDFALLAVDKVIDGDPAAMDKAEREALRGQLANLRGNETSQAVIDSLKAKAKITIQLDES